IDTLYLLFSQHSRHPPDVPSFPTRRSSDSSSWTFNSRSNWRTRRLRVARGTRNFTAAAERLPVRTTATNISAALRSIGRSFQMRSEEHTSELQSHLNIVCRLLLAKKNNK